MAAALSRLNVSAKRLQLGLQCTCNHHWRMSSQGQLPRLNICSASRSLNTVSDLRFVRSSTPRISGSNGCIIPVFPWTLGRQCALAPPPLKWWHPIPITASRQLSSAAASPAAGDDDTVSDSKPSVFRRGGWRKWLKLILRLIFGGAVVLVAVIAALPAILSTAKGRQASLAIANQFLPATVSVSQASLGWGQPVQLEGIQISEPQTLGGHQLLKIESISSSSTLADIARGREFDLVVTQPWVDCSVLPSGTTRWGRLSEGPLELAQSITLAQAETSAQAATSDMKFSAEGRYLNGQIYVSDGVLQVPREVFEVMGDDLHFSAILGRGNLQNEAADFGVDASEVLDDSQQHRGSPLAVVINSAHVGGELRGWRKQGEVYLQGPATAHVDFTPALAKYCLAKVSPLLADIVAVEEGGIVAVAVSPENMQLSADRFSFRLEPLKLKVGRGQLLGKALDFLQLRDRALGKSQLEAQTSVIHVDVVRSGAVTTHRLDFLIGSSSSNKGVHLVMWGTFDSAADHIDMILGIPADTLALLGLKGLPPKAVLPIKLAGSLDNARPDWGGTYKSMAALTMRQNEDIEEGTPSSLRGAIVKNIFGAIAKRRGSKEEAAGLLEAPMPIEALPWEEKVQ